MSTHQEPDYKPGSMDISEHLRFYASVLGVGKWLVAIAVLFLVLMAIFRTN